MENNIPFGFDDQGQPDVIKVYGTSKSENNNRFNKEVDKINEAEWREKIKGFPTNISDADFEMNKIRKQKALNHDSIL